MRVLLSFATTFERPTVHPALTMLDGLPLFMLMLIRERLQSPSLTVR